MRQRWVGLLVIIIMSSLANIAFANEELPYLPQTNVSIGSEFEKLTQLKFDEPTFELAYKSFLYTGNVNEAYALCLAATKAEPDSVLWQSRLAQTALWSNRMSTAVNAYYYLVTSLHQDQYLAKAIPLSETVFRYDLVINLVQQALRASPQNPELIIKLAKAYNGLGKTKTAIHLLKSEFQKQPNPEFIKTMAYIEDQSGDIDAAYHTLKHYESLTHSTVNIALLNEDYFFSKANLTEAYLSLYKIHAKTSVSETTYWSHLANIAFVTAHYEQSKMAYTLLFQQQAIDQEGLRRLLLLQDQNDALQMLTVANVAWKKFKSNFAFFAITSVAPSVHAWPLLISLYQTPLPHEQKISLENEPAYWAGLAYLLDAYGYHNEARNLLKASTKTHQHNPQFKMAYVDFLQMQLSDALLHNNRVEMHALVTTEAKLLPLKDRVNAAMQAGDEVLAETLAYDSLKQKPDAETLSIFESVMLKTATKITLNPEFEQFGNLQGNRLIVTGDWYHAGWQFSPLISVWNPVSNNTGNLASHSYFEEIAGLTAVLARERATLMLNANRHRAFFNSNNALADLEFRLSSTEIIGGRLAYNQRSTQDTFMLIAGSEDDMLLRYSKQLTARDQLSTQLEYDHYYLQDRTSLGSGRIFTGILNHQLAFEYPDIGVSWVTDINRYTRYNAYLGSRVGVIFPKSITPAVSDFVPDNFWQTSLTLNIGDSAAQPYQHAFKPYIDGGLIYDSTAGYGSQFSLGGQGSLLGHDQLKVYYTRSSINSGQSQTNFMIGVNYVTYLD